MAKTALRDRVRIERRAIVPDDGFGNTRGDWEELATLSADILELTGGEFVQAAKLEGRGVCTVMLRASALTRSITADDRIVDRSLDRVMNIRHVAQPRLKSIYVLLTCEYGVADG